MLIGFRTIQMSFLSAFVGVSASKYSAIAIALSILFVSLAMLIGKESIPLGQKLLAVMLMILFSLPAIALTLMQITCMVTGAGLQGQRWWCSIYAWVMAAFIILYSVMLVAVAILAMVGEKEAKTAEAFGASMESANAMAHNTFAAVEPFEDEKDAPTTDAGANLTGEEPEPEPGMGAETFAMCGAAY